MSRSNPETILTNPATRFFDWAGDSGELRYYDREAKENIKVKTPFRFLVLDDVVQVGGGIKRNGSYVGYWSNAVKSRELKTAVLVVRSSTNGQTRIEAEGPYEQIKAEVTGAKYIKGLYIGYLNDDKELEIGYLKFKGAALTAWIEFHKAQNLKDSFKGAFTIKGRSDELQNGNTTYYEPVFTWTDKVTEETEAAAIELDQTLQEYLVPYFAQGRVEPEYSGHQPNDEPTEEDEERAAISSEPKAKAAAAGDDDDIPF